MHLLNASRDHRMTVVEIARRAQKEAETSISRGSNHCVLITRRLLSSDWLVIPENHRASIFLHTNHRLLYPFPISSVGESIHKTMAKAKPAPPKQSPAKPKPVPWPGCEKPKVSEWKFDDILKEWGIDELQWNIMSKEVIAGILK
jgi:hypothetical protein